MIRFIDLRGQITDVEECPVEFAFFDTTTDRFLESRFGTQTWENRKELRACAEDNDWQVARLFKLLPEWVV